ncbi:hypothetical protein ACFL1C_10870 [Pseudomonadota bacterium]
MSPLLRYSSAAVGMVLLAGLAYYQGGMEPAAGEQEMLAGTVIPETIENMPVADRNENPESGCEQASETDQADREPCSEKNQ